MRKPDPTCPTPGIPISIKGGFVLTPERAWCSGLDAANAQMRKAGRKDWNDDDWNKAVEVQARLIRHLGEPYATIARQMMGEP